MDYFDFLFGLLSYTTGIGATTLLILQYLRYNKTLVLRELIFFNLCFTFYFILELLYRSSSAWLRVLILSGAFFTKIGMVYFVGAYFYRILHREIDQKFKAILWSAAAITGGILILLYTLSQKHLVIESIAFHTGCTVINFFTFLMFGYSVCLANKNLKTLDRERKQVMPIIVIVTLTLLPASVIQDLLLYRVQLKHPIAFTPLAYFIINLAIIVYYIRNYIKTIPAEITNLHAFDKENLPLSHVAIIKEHNITERELEVLQLILNGYSNHEISKKLFISSNTARNHIYSIFKKLDVKNRLELSKIFY
jgi:DNA-binding CsgD family transcriptional regulator